MPVLLSLLSAMCYGLGDFVGGFASKRTNPWSVALVAQLGGATVILAVTLVTGGSPTGQDLLWAVVAGVGNGFGTAFLYRGLSSGRMGVVAPVSGVGTALVPVAVGVLAGERPAALVWTGIVLALPGIWLVAREPVDPGARDVQPGNGLVDGILAGLGFGSLFAALAQIPEEAGFLPLAVNQLVACAAVIAVATALRSRWFPREAAGRGRSRQRRARGAGHGRLPRRHAGRLPDRDGRDRLALPGLHGAARRDGAARARAPGPDRRPGPVRGRRGTGRGRLSSLTRPYLRAGQ